MAFRFQKRIKLLPGVTINLSKSGVSTSIGPKGARVTLGHGKVRQTVGLPGTGLSHSTTTRRTPDQPEDRPAAAGGTLNLLIGIGVIAALIALASWLVR